MDKKVILLAMAAICLGLYFYGSQIKKDNEYVQYLPIIGGLAFGLNTLIQIAQSEEPEISLQPTKSHGKNRQ